MKDKYILLKKIYPNYLVLIKKKSKLYTYKIDKKIFDKYNFKKIRHIIEENFNLKFKNHNNYETYHFKINLIDYLEKKKEKIKYE